MRVLFVIASLEAVHGGGTAERSYRLARHLAALGSEVSVLTTDIGEGHRRLDGIDGVRTIVLHSMLDRFYLPSPDFQKVYRAVAEADVLHIMNHWTAINVMAYWAARRAGRPYVFSPAGALPSYGRSRHIKAAYNQVAGCGIVRRAARGIAITETEVAHFASYGVPRDRIVVIPNGVDLDDLEECPSVACPVPGLGDKPFVLFIGRLNTIKGPDLLLEAFLAAAPAFPDIQLVFAGPDEGLETPLRRVAAIHFAANRVHFAGPVFDNDKRWLLRHAQLVAIPSRQEAMSIVVLEAGACARPVLLTDQCGFPMLAEHAGGLIVEASAPALEQGLRQLLASGVPLRDMGTRLKRLVEERFTWRVAAQSLQNCLRTILAETGPKKG